MGVTHNTGGSTIMAFSKINFYVSLIFIMSVLVLAFMDFGLQIINHDKANINNDSYQYIIDYTGIVETNQLNTINDSNAEFQQESLTGLSNDTEQSTIEDMLASIKYYQTRTNKFITYFKLAYNTPSFFIASFNLPASKFRNFINIIGIILFIGLLYMTLKIVRGS